MSFQITDEPEFAAQSERVDPDVVGWALGVRRGNGLTMRCSERRHRTTVAIAASRGRRR